MASPCITPTQNLFSIATMISIFLAPLPSSVSSLSFNYSDFNGGGMNSVVKVNNITLLGDASFGEGGSIQLTKKRVALDQNFTTGRAVYRQPLLLWDKASGDLTNFVTHFSFKISNASSGNSTARGSGMAFFLAPFPSDEIPLNSGGGYLGLFNNSANQFVAVEFDSADSAFELPDTNNSHVGMDVDSVLSIAYVPLGIDIVMNNTGQVSIRYDAGSKNLSVILNYDTRPQAAQGRQVSNWNLSTTIDLRDYLPEIVAVGFSGSTFVGSNYTVRGAEAHTILSWDFSSTLDLNANSTAAKITTRSRGLTRVFLKVFLGTMAFACGVGLPWFALWCQKKFALWFQKIQRKRKEDSLAADVLELSDDDGIFDNGGRGPKRFRYEELAAATRNFADERKLGQGGFGSVYLGVLPGKNSIHVAIKRISKGSMQGKKEYMSEVSIISRLPHRNLVQLIGYCHERGEFLLVYQYMPNRSLDSHLYSNERILGWPERYQISIGLASALLYLHEEWEQCVVHRDLKPSNVMLDSDFNPKLGDFGLARLVDHDNNATTTILAGTRGYMAPEYEETGKASKESDVYSFGVVLLEIACGRKPIDLTELVDGKVNLIGWVRDLHTQGTCLSAADSRLNGEFDKQLMERLMVVGLWCAHPDSELRPTIRRAIGLLSFDAPLPDLTLLPPIRRAFTRGRTTTPMSVTNFSTSLTLPR